MISKNQLYWLTRYCSEDISLIKGFQEALNSDEIYDCHHLLETDLGLSKKELIEKDLYYKRPASELVLLTKNEHSRIHGKIKCNIKNEQLSEEHKQKISDSHKGKKLSEETKKKISNVLKGKCCNHNAGKHRVYDNTEHTKWHMEN